MKLVVGLGNPGFNYKKTKHNAGFWVLDQIAKEEKVELSKHKFNSLYGEGYVNNEKFILIKPLTFMNLSGKAVKYFFNYFKVNLEDILIVFDDVNLSLGDIRFRDSGSAGGHNGLSSIIDYLGTADFPRLRLGTKTGEYSDNLSNYVLSGFSDKKNSNIAKEMVRLAKEAVLCWLNNGIVFAMNKYNKKKEVTFKS